MVTRVQLIAEARTWLGTRWHHQAAAKGAGCDCIGLVRGVGINLGLFEPAAFDQPGAEMLLDYHRAPYDQRLQDGCKLFFRGPFPKEQAEPGDILLMRWGNGAPNHLAIRTDLGIIHAYVPVRKVVESSYGDDFFALTVSVYRYPEVT